MVTREPGQRMASAKALDVYMHACDKASDARSLVFQLQAQLKDARKSLKEAEAVEAEALQAYESTPYAE